MFDFAYNNLPMTGTTRASGLFKNVFVTSMRKFNKVLMIACNIAQLGTYNVSCRPSFSNGIKGISEDRQELLVATPRMYPKAALSDFLAKGKIGHRHIDVLLLQLNE